MCTRDAPAIAKGDGWCGLGERFSVAFPTLNAPQSRVTVSGPWTGVTGEGFVVAVAPRGLVCPRGGTWPVGAVAVVGVGVTTPTHRGNSFGDM